eukprot:3858657-Prymnesium_polylepis.1
MMLFPRVSLRSARTQCRKHYVQKGVPYAKGFRAKGWPGTRSALLGKHGTYVKLIPHGADFSVRTVRHSQWC